MPSMRSSLKVVLVFSGASSASDHINQALSLEGFRDNAVENISVFGDTAAAVLDPSVWDSTRQRLAADGKQMCIITPPCFTFLKKFGLREVGSLKENGVRLKGKEKENVRCETLCLKRAADLCLALRGAGLPFLLVLPFGEEFVFNPAAHSAFKSVLDDDHLDHHNILTKSVVELRGSGLSLFGGGGQL